MPFTISHAAAAIPFQRTRLVLSALVIGCMAPDFEYFLRFHPGGAFGHRLPGVFLFDLPVSLLALWLFHAYAKEPLYTWMPKRVRQRIRLGPTAMPIGNVKQFALVCLSILIGVATHVVWDSFTHESLGLYSHWQFLSRMVELPFGRQMEYGRVIQHVSTVVGAVALLLWFRNWYRKTAPVAQETAAPQKNRRAGLLVVCVVALTVAMLQGFLIHPHGRPWHFHSGKFFIESAIITAITVFWLGVVLYGVYRALLRGHLQDA